MNIPKFAKEIHLRGVSRWVVYGVLVGVAAGGVAVLYVKLLHLAEFLITQVLGGLRLQKPYGEGGELSVRARWVLLFMPAVGGLLVGWIHHRWPFNLVDATEGYVNIFHRFRAYINPKWPFQRLLTSVITISTGGSAGKEGPAIFAASSVAGWLSKILRLPEKERRVFFVAGGGGVLGAIFRAPIGGALYASEVLYRGAHMEAEAITPAIITSVTAYAIFGFFESWSPVFSTPHYYFKVIDFPFFGLLGVLVAGVAFLYVKSLERIRFLFKILRIPPWVKPGLGGLAVGAVLFFVPHVAGTSYGILQSALYGHFALNLVLLLIALKIVATALTIGSGGSGGVFAPAVVTGGLTGLAFGLGLKTIGLTQQPEAYALVGMGAFLAAAAKVPLSAIIIVAEMAGNYELLAPMTLAASLAFLVSRRFTLYPTQVEAPWHSPAHLGELTVDLMERLRVSDALSRRRFVSLRPEMSLREAVKKVAGSHQEVFPVIDSKGKLVGILCEEDLRDLIFGSGEEVEDVLLVQDVMRLHFKTLNPNDTLGKAVELFMSTGVHELPVVDDGRCLGTLSYEELVRAYKREMIRRSRG